MHMKRAKYKLLEERFPFVYKQTTDNESLTENFNNIEHKVKN